MQRQFRFRPQLDVPEDTPALKGEVPAAPVPILTRMRCRAALRVATVAVLALAAISGPVRAGFDDELVAALNKVGGTIKRDKEPAYPGEFRPIVEVSFKPDAKFDDAWPHLAQLPLLNVVSFAKVKAFGDADAKHLARLVSLKSVSLAGTRVTDDGLKHLAEVDGLERVDLSETTVTDEGLAHLAGLSKLRSLGLNKTKVTGNGLKVLAKLERLEELSLADTTVGDEAIDHIGRMVGLKIVKLERTRMTEQGVKNLQAALPRLQIQTATAQTTPRMQTGPDTVPANPEKDILNLGHGGAKTASLLVPSPDLTVFAVTNAVRNGRVITTGTVTLAKEGGYLGYDAEPRDRLVVKQSGMSTLEYTISQMTGDFTDVFTFLDRNHTLAYRVTNDRGMDVGVEMIRNGRQFQTKHKGLLNLASGKYDIDLTMVAMSSYEGDLSGFDRSDRRTYTGTIKNASLELIIDETETFRSLKGGRDIVSNDQRRINNKIIAGTTTYQWNNVLLKKTYKNGKVTSADRDGWTCAGEVTAGERRVASYKKDLEAFRQAPGGSGIQFKIEASTGSILLGTWRLSED
jgi:hypothetical protein